MSILHLLALRTNTSTRRVALDYLWLMKPRIEVVFALDSCGRGDGGRGAVSSCPFDHGNLGGTGLVGWWSTRP